MVATCAPPFDKSWIRPCPMHYFCAKQIDMVEIELPIPLVYLGIIRISSTETAKIAHFVFFFLLLIVPSA